MPQIALPSDSQPRSVIVYFQEFKVKEMVLRSKKGKFSTATEGFTLIMTIQQKHWQKERRTRRLVLSEKREYDFQTQPPAKLQVFFEGGPVTYGSVDEVAEDLKK